MNTDALVLLLIILEYGLLLWIITWVFRIYPIVLDDNVDEESE